MTQIIDIEDVTVGDWGAVRGAMCDAVWYAVRGAVWEGPSNHIEGDMTHED